MTATNVTPHSTSPQEDFLEAALQYADLGWSIIPIAEKKEPPRGFKWKQYQTERPGNMALRRWFNRDDLSGLAVVLGPVSGGLYCRDFDELGSYERWTNLHPEHANALPTVVTSRGQHVYFNLDAELPTQVYDDGELRGTGAYVVLPPSIHESGHVYTWTTPNKQPPLIDPEAAGLLQSYSLIQRGQRVQRERRVLRRTERTEEVGGEHALRNDHLSVDEIVSIALPEGPHNNHHKLFELARGVKALEKQEQRELTKQELQRIFAQWYESAQPFLRADQSFDEYRFEFLDGLERVKYPLGEDVLTDAWERAITLTPPAEAEEFQLPQVRILVTLCRELQLSAGDGPFYLACRTVQRLFLQETHITAARWLKGLVSTGIIEVVEPGTTSRACRYRYTAPL